MPADPNHQERRTWFPDDCGEEQRRFTPTSACQAPMEKICPF
ncbi:MAG: hypothetical protein R2825_07615 [Saprospiraceae bacterium]